MTDSETSAKRDALVKRIRGLEEAMARSREYLESGLHADWAGFRPVFARKKRDGKDLPPHKDWVRNVYLPRLERELSRAEKLLEQFTE
jgi:hypothetical protein